MRPLPRAVLPAVVVLLAAAGCGRGHGHRVRFGDGQEVYYKDGATEADARRLGEFLTRVGYFEGDGPRSVQIVRPGGVWQVRMVLREGAWDNQAAQRLLARTGADIGVEVLDGADLELHLCDGRLKTRHVIRPLVLGARLQVGAGQVVFYRDGATRQDAEAVAALLRARGLFGRGGVTVQLRTEAGRYQLRLVVDAAGHEPKDAARFEADLRKAMGGRDAEIQLVDRALRVLWSSRGRRAAAGGPVP